MSNKKELQTEITQEMIENVLKNDSSLPDIMISLKGYEIAMITDVLKKNLGDRLPRMEELQKEGKDIDKIEGLMVSTMITIHQKMLRYFVETLIPEDTKEVRH